MRLLNYLAIASFALTTAVLASDPKPLVTPSALAANLKQSDLVVLDIRGDAYNDGHIPGSISAPYSLFRGPKNNPGQLSDVNLLEKHLENLGLQIDDRIVIASAGKTDTDFGAAARVYWTLKSTGFDDLAILNGGTLLWENEGYATDKISVNPEKTELDIEFSYQWTAETDQVVSVTKGEVDAILLDARPITFYEGEKSHGAASRPGTLPNAKNYDYTSFFDEGSAAIAGITDIATLAKDLGIDNGDEVVSFCNTGHWAATNWFALSEVAGLDNIKLYPGSMVEYSNLDLPMENTPGLLKNLVKSISGN